MNYLRWRAFDIRTEGGRAAERYRLALWTVLADVISKSASLLLMVLSVSLAVPYLGAERFGVWMTISSFAGMLVFLDLGIGNALANRVAQVAATGDAAALGRTITGGLGLLCLVSMAVAALLAGLAAVAPWHLLIKVRDVSLLGEIRDAGILFAGLFGTSLFVGGLQKVYAGLQRSFEAHLVAACASGVALILLLLATHAHAGVPVLLLITLGCPQVGAVALLWGLRRRRLLGLRHLAASIAGERRALLHVGALFFVLQIGGIVQTGADGLIVSSVLGSAQFAVYAVTQRLFQLVSIPLGVVNAPLWAAYADAHARGDRAFIVQTLRRSLTFTVSVALSAGMLLTAAGPLLIQAWTSNHITVAMPLVVAFFIWTTCEVVGNAIAMFLNGCGVVREQVWTVAVLVVLALPGKYLFVKNFGLEGLLLFYSATFAVVVSLSYGVVFRKRLIHWSTHG